VPRLTLVALLLAAACAGQEPDPPAAGTLAAPPGAQEAVVVRHTDGDTLVLRGIGTGPLPGTPAKVRVLEIDTPEVNPVAECLGPEAADRLAELVPKGSRVRVEADREKRDRYGRLLLYVWTADGVSVEEVLLREGLARVLYVRPNDRHLDHFRVVEAEARDAGRGLWRTCR
jgi:micrococcal nuclease